MLFKLKWAVITALLIGAVAAVVPPLLHVEEWPMITMGVASGAVAFFFGVVIIPKREPHLTRQQGAPLPSSGTGISTGGGQYGRPAIWRRRPGLLPKGKTSESKQ